MKINQALKPAGVFVLKHFREGEQVGEDIISLNLVTTEGKDYMSDTFLNNAAIAQTSWYLALYGNNLSPAETDTAATVASRLGELAVEIQETNRPGWTANAGNTGASSSNSDAPGVFTMVANDDIYGAYLISSNVKSGTQGVLLAVSKFGTSRTVELADVLQLTYEIRLT